MLVGGLALASLTMVSGADAQAPRGGSCLPQQAHALAEDRDVRIYSIEARHAVGGRQYTHEVMYACLLRNGSTLKLTEPHHHRPASNELVALDGTMVAYAYSDVGVDTGSTEIIVANAASHRIVLTVPDAASFVDACIISFRELKDLVVTARGSVAWMLRTGHGCQTETFQVYDESVSGEPTLLDEGLGIDPKSLRSSSRSVIWGDGGQQRYAPLP
jgi:hypothetical protein